MDTNVTPKISVILPVYNGETYIAKAVESILNQTYKDFEFLIISNASTDSTPDILKKYTDPRIRIIWNEVNKGLIGSLNIGLQEARGEYIARMDHDDIAYPDRFKKEVELLNTHPEIAIVGTWSTLINPEGKVIRTHRNSTRSNVIKFNLLFGNSITHPSIMMRRKEIIELGGYDPEWVHTEDYNLYSRAIKKYKLANIPEPLLYYRVHGSSLTGSPDSQAIIHGNTKKMIRVNISEYYPITYSEHRLITEVLIARLPNPEQKLIDVFAAYKIHKKIYKAFLKKELENLDSQDLYELRKRYVGRRNLMFKTYLVGKYHLFFKKHD